MTDKDPGLQVRNTPPFKLKDRPNRQFQILNLKKQFGFLPEIIVIEKLPRENNRIFVRAVLTDEEIKKQKALEVKPENEKSSSKKETK